MALWGRMSRIVGEWICIYAPATSTITKRICFIYKWVRFVVVLFVVLFGFLHEKWMPAQHFGILLRRHFYVF